MIDHSPIKIFRESKTPGMSQSELARLLGVSRFTVLRWERDGRPDEALLPKIVELTGIPAKELRPDIVEKHEEIFGDPSPPQAPDSDGASSSSLPSGESDTAVTPDFAPSDSSPAAASESEFEEIEQ